MFEHFFKRYSDAFLNFNSDLVSDVYEFPMTFYAESGDSISFTQNEFVSNTQKLIAMYQRIGVRQVSFDIESNISLSQFLNLVSVVWHFKDAEDKKIYSATTRYVMNSSHSKLKIKSVFVVDETTQFNRLVSK